VDKALEKIKEEGMNAKNVKMISNSRFQHEFVWRYKLKSEDINHRIIFDHLQNGEIKILMLARRDKVYEE